MSPEQSEQPPRWLSRSDARQAFVVTLCSATDVNEALAILRTALGDMPILGRESLGANSCAITIECEPAEAWDLLRTLRRRLQSTDVYLQPQGSEPIRLLICDMDMTIVAAETLDEVAAELGMGERIAAITTRAMRGEIDFDDALRERIAMLAGQPVQVFHEVASKLQLNPGASEMIVEGAQNSDFSNAFPAISVSVFLN